MPRGTMIETPVVFIIFKRSDTAWQVFQAIRRYRPRKLYVIADGPRDLNAKEALDCEATRKLIDRVDWECDVRKNFADRNMGCGERISSGLDWVFQNEERAVILEDDCVPSQSFFTFCGEVLERYKDSENVMHVNGTNFTPCERRNRDSYFFSRYVHIWGWATWRRAWKHYDYGMKNWPDFRDEGWMMDVFQNKKAAEFWTHFLDLCHDKKITPTTWDYQWLYTVWSRGGICITPVRNLVSNVGLTGVHTSLNAGDPGAAGFLKERDETFTITRHPEFLVPDKEYDDYHFRNYLSQSILKRVRRKVWRMTNAIRSGRGGING